MPFFLIWLLALNGAAFLAMGKDKSFARRKMHRIPEATFFLLAVLGGSPGAIAGMYVFRHKTKHLSFVLGLPAVLLAQLALLWLFGVL